MDSSKIYERDKFHTLIRIHALFIIILSVFGLLWIALFPEFKKTRIINKIEFGYEVFWDDEQFHSFTRLSYDEQATYISENIWDADINDMENRIYLFSDEYVRNKTNESLTKLLDNLLNRKEMR